VNRLWRGSCSLGFNLPHQDHGKTAIEAGLFNMAWSILKAMTKRGMHVFLSGLVCKYSVKAIQTQPLAKKRQRCCGLSLDRVH